MTTPNDIITWVEELQGWPIHHEEGIHHGSGDSEITGLTVCWKATPGAIAEAGTRGDNLLIGHESLHYPYYFDFDPSRTKGWQEWRINTQRMAALDTHGQTYLRLHSSIDSLTIATDMAAWFDLEGPVTDDQGRRAYQIPECTLEELVAKVKKVTGMPAIRVAAPRGLSQKVRRVGLLVGGAALCPNGGAFEPGARAGIDVYIAGETDNYGFRYAAELGIALIETSHEVSENPGFKRFATMIQDTFPDVRVTFYENTVPYVVM